MDRQFLVLNLAEFSYEVGQPSSILKSAVVSRVISVSDTR